MFALGIVPAVAPGLKFVHQHKAKPTRYWPASVVQAISEVNDIFRRAESGHGELVDLFSAVLLSVLFCIIALAIVQKITEPTLLCILGRRTFNKPKFIMGNRFLVVCLDSAISISP